MYELKRKLAEGYELYELQVNRQVVPVLYKKHWLSAGDEWSHIEFYSHQISETGYRSHFESIEQIEAYGGVMPYLQGLAQELHEELFSNGEGKKLQETLFS